MGKSANGLASHWINRQAERGIICRFGAPWELCGVKTAKKRRFDERSI
jgi:hypothetical protein